MQPLCISAHSKENSVTKEPCSKLLMLQWKQRWCHGAFLTKFNMFEIGRFTQATVTGFGGGVCWWISSRSICLHCDLQVCSLLKRNALNIFCHKLYFTILKASLRNKFSLFSDSPFLLLVPLLRQRRSQVNPLVTLWEKCQKANGSTRD